MCRMCSYYTRIDIKLLSTTNPFSEEYLSPVESTLPYNIIVESPESRRHTAWTNLRRFPSLHSPALLDSTQSSKESSKGITIRGPRELAKEQTVSYQHFRPQQRPATQTFKRSDASITTPPRRLYYHDRVDSLGSSYSPVSDTSSSGGPQGSISPVSEDEFAYLPSSPRLWAKTGDMSFLTDTSRVLPDAEVPIPPPLKIRRAEDSSVAWIDQMCKNL